MFQNARKEVAMLLAQTIRELNIADRLSYIPSDNATANYTAMVALFKLL